MESFKEELKTLVGTRAFFFVLGMMVATNDVASVVQVVRTFLGV